MAKVAFLFPGQGAQYPGMGKDFYDMYPLAREVYKMASEASGLDVEALCFGHNEQLNITEYTQIAMLATEVAILKVAMEKGIRADVCAGLSLGEYCALAAADVMELSDLFHLIRQRGIFMQEAYPVGGGMTAVLGMDADKIAQICEETEGIVTIANYNCPGQIVISGEKEAVDKAAESMASEGARRCIPLRVSGPFHSPLLKGAGEKLAAELAGVSINAPSIPYVCNTKADYVTDASQIKQILADQVSSSVMWEQSIRRMIKDGVDTFIEIGPGKTLAGFMKKIDKNVKMLNIETVEDMNKVMEEVGLC